MSIDSFEREYDAQCGNEIAANEVVVGDARSTVPRFPETHLTVTSPPYLGAIDYDEHITGDRDYRNGKPEELNKWLDIQRRIFSELLDVTVDGGFCCVVISHVKSQDGDWVALPHHFGTMMREVGWNFHERIVWNKVTGGKATFASTVQHPYPTYYYPNKMHEEIQIWRKGDIRHERDEDAKLEMNDLMKKEIANNVWHIAPTPPNAGVDHPCPFPEELAYRLVMLYSNTDEVVADPFLGSGTTAKTASHLDREYVGCDLREEYVRTARKRVDEEFERRDQLIPSYDSIDFE